MSNVPGDVSATIQDCIEWARLVAERDGWKSIATKLLHVAFGDDFTDFDIPPLELVELRAVGDLPGKAVPQLAQFWRKLVDAHVTKQRARVEAARSAAKRRGRNGVVISILAAEAIPAGSGVCIGDDGRAHVTQSTAWATAVAHSNGGVVQIRFTGDEP